MYQKGSFWSMKGLSFRGRFGSEIEGARKTLLEQGKASKTKAHFSALKDKPLSSLTNEEKEHLKTLTQRPKTPPKT